jgi:hypothetical protein
VDNILTLLCHTIPSSICVCVCVCLCVCARVCVCVHGPLGDRTFAYGRQMLYCHLSMPSQAPLLFLLNFETGFYYYLCSGWPWILYSPASTFRVARIIATQESPYLLHSLILPALLHNLLVANIISDLLWAFPGFVCSFLLQFSACIWCSIINLEALPQA